LHRQFTPTTVDHSISNRINIYQIIVVLGMTRSRSAGAMVDMRDTQ
jgi:hypothetical protein